MYVYVNIITQYTKLFFCEICFEGNYSVYLIPWHSWGYIMEIMEDFLRKRKEFVVGYKYKRNISVFLGLIVIGILGVVVVGQVLQPEKAPLLDQPFTADEQTHIMAQFQMWQQRYEVEEGQILVPANKQIELIGRLGYMKLLPEDISLGFTRIVLPDNNDDVYMSSDQREMSYIISKQTILSRCLENFPGISQAEVFINLPNRRRWNNITPQASVSVLITTSSGKVTNSKLAKLITDFICSANKNLRRKNVSVVANGEPLVVLSEDQLWPNEYQVLKSQYEQYFREKIKAISDVPNTLVSVNVQPESLKSDTGKGIHDTTKEREPGSNANTRAGRIENIEVTILYPQSFFRKMAQLKSTNNQEEPTGAEVQAQKDIEIPILQKKVMDALGLDETQKNRSRVYVGTYWDKDYYYTVQPGDSLWTIAQRELHDATRHDEIARLNQISEGQIHVDQILIMPQKKSSEVLPPWITLNPTNSIDKPEDPVPDMQPPSTVIEYNDDHKDLYGKILDAPHQFPEHVILRDPEIIPSPNRHYTATLQETSSKNPPEYRYQTSITFTRHDGVERYLFIKGFRIVDLNWGPK